MQRLFALFEAFYLILLKFTYLNEIALTVELSI